MDNPDSFKGDPNDFNDNQGRYNPFSTSHMNKTNYTKTKSDTYRENVLRLLAATMNANGKQMVCELDQVKESIKKMYKSESQQKIALNKFKEYLKDYRVNIPKLCQGIRSSYNKSTCELLILELLSVAFADGVYQAAEKEVIKQIYRSLGITDVEYITLESMFRVQKKAGLHGDTYIQDDNEYERRHSRRDDYYSSSSYGNGSSYNSSNGSNSRSYGNSNRSNSGNNSNYNSNYNSGNNSNYNSGYRPNIDEEIEHAYKTLGVKPDATNDEIKSARKKLLVKWHPDLYEAQGEAAVRRATENCKIINKAYDIICERRGIK